MKTGTELITEERERQISKEGWTPEHDDTHLDGEMGMAALSYILAADYRGQNPEEPLTYWPWDHSYFKPVADPVRNLVKAGALIAAEIDRLQRAQRDEARKDYHEIKLELSRARDEISRLRRGATAPESIVRIAKARKAQLDEYCAEQLHRTGPGERPWSTEVDEELEQLAAFLKA